MGPGGWKMAPEGNNRGEPPHPPPLAGRNHWDPALRLGQQVDPNALSPKMSLRGPHGA